MPGARDVDGHEVYGPCERCGVVFTSGMTTCQPICPNCGHRAPGKPLPRSVTGIEASPVPTEDPDVLRVDLQLSLPRTVPPRRDRAWACWRMN